MKLKIIIVRNLDPKCERIKDRLTDFTIFCVQQYCPYEVVNSIDEVVFSEDCKYILFIKAGHLFWDTSIFEKCIAQASTVSGDVNWLLVDVKKLDGKPVDRSNPTPFDDTINSMKYYSYPEEMALNLEALMDDLQIEVPDKLKPFADQLNFATDNLARGYYVINTEAISQHTSKNYNRYIGVCGGLKSVVLLGRDCFANDTRSLMFDISPAAVKWQQHLREYWNGDSKSFNECQKTFSKKFPNYMPINDSSIEEFMKQNNIDNAQLQTAWNKYKRIKVEFETLDIFNNDHKNKMINFSNSGSTYFWISNCFIMERIIFQKGFEKARQIEKEWIQDFKTRSSMHCTFSSGGSEE
jgi:hypothetical protein